MLKTYIILINDWFQVKNQFLLNTVWCKNG